MREDGLAGVHRGRTPRTTRPDTTAVRPSELVKREFTAARPNQLCVVDFTYVATFYGFVYVAFAIDVFSRMIVGWRAARAMRTDLPLDALDTARRGAVAGLAHHSDAGSQPRTPRSATPNGWSRPGRADFVADYARPGPGGRPAPASNS